MKPLDRIGASERAIIDERSSSGYAAPLDRFRDVESTLRALLERLLPGVAANVDLAAFIDQQTGKPLGRGDRPAGLPTEPELFAQGLAILHAEGFEALSDEDQRGLIGRMRHGDADRKLGFRAKDFIDRLLEKALTGYLAHPDTWLRIGFTGPAFPEGYAWIGPAEAVARHAKKPGWAAL